QARHPVRLVRRPAGRPLPGRGGLDRGPAGVRLRPPPPAVLTMAAPPPRLSQASRAGLVGGLVLAAVVVALLVPFLGADPPYQLTYTNARATDEGLHIHHAR